MERKRYFQWTWIRFFQLETEISFTHFLRCLLRFPICHFLFVYCRVLCLFTILCRKFAGNGINYSQYSKFSVCLGEGQLTCFPALGIIREAILARRECERNLRQLCNWQERVRLDVAGDRHTLTHTHTQPSKNNMEFQVFFAKALNFEYPQNGIHLSAPVMACLLGVWLWFKLLGVSRAQIQKQRFLSAYKQQLHWSMNSFSSSKVERNYISYLYRT